MYITTATNLASDPQLLATRSESQRSTTCACNSLRFTTIPNKGLKSAYFHTLPQKRGGGTLSKPPCLAASLPPLTPGHRPRLKSVRERNPQDRNGNGTRREAAQTHPSRLHPVQRHVHGHARPVRRQAVSQLPQGLGSLVHSEGMRVIFLPLVRNSPVTRP